MIKNALLKKRPKKVEFNGELILVRSLTLREATSWDATVPGLSGTELLIYVMQFCTDMEGNPIFAKDDPDIEDVPLDVIPELAETIQKVSSGRKLETVAKN